MNERDSASFAKARDYAFLLLKYRPRSERELHQRLRKKGFSEDASRLCLSFLREHRFIDDNDFARVWITTRIKKPLGLIRLRNELRQKGVEAGIIEAEIQKVRDTYSEEEVVSQLARRKLETLRGLEPQKAKSRIYAFLARRGFSPETISDVVNRL